MSELVKIAKEAVEEHLQIHTFINERKYEIYRRLENSYIQFGGADSESRGLMFVAESLPLISSIIFVGSTTDKFSAAINWISQALPNAKADPVSALSALTFIYIIDKGWNEFAAPDIPSRREEDRDRKFHWEEIHKQADALLFIKPNGN